MNGTTPKSRLHTRLIYIAALAAAAVATVMCALFNQPLAAALIPVVAGLALALQRRDDRARLLARRVSAEDATGKLEVPPGLWGELARAVNHLLHERRLHRRLAAALPAPLPQPAIAALLDGRLRETSGPRTVVALVARPTLARERHAPRGPLDEWRDLATVARAQSEAHNALLQPCGDSVLLVFGVFAELPCELSLDAAQRAAEAFQRHWAERGREPLAIGMACGPAWLAAPAGFGFCAVGAPVEQALQLARISAETSRYRLLCSASTYYSLRRGAAPGWEATGLHTVGGRRPQEIYGLSA